ncbi:MAG: hypothetical protein IKK92_13950 [Prevotella sp.]|nr:hypothetical protein [Prevotella sp.]
MAEQPELNITKDELIPYIKTQGELLAKEINKAKEKYGSRYNTKNKFEIMRDKFGDPRWCAEQFANEWFLILQKSSKLPASVRYPVRDICQAAMNQCYHDKLVALYKKQQEEKAKEGDNGE